MLFGCNPQLKHQRALDDPNGMPKIRIRCSDTWNLDPRHTRFSGENLSNRSQACGRSPAAFHTCVLPTFYPNGRTSQQMWLCPPRGTLNGSHGTSLWPLSISTKASNMDLREIRSNSPTPSIDTMVARGSNSVNACSTWAMHSVPLWSTLHTEMELWSFQRVNWSAVRWCAPQSSWEHLLQQSPEIRPRASAMIHKGIPPRNSPKSHRECASMINSHNCDCSPGFQENKRAGRALMFRLTPRRQWKRAGRALSFRMKSRRQ